MSKLSSRLKAFERGNYGFMRDTAHAEQQPSELTPRQLAAQKRSEAIRLRLIAEKSGQDLSPESKRFYGIK